jgi:DNA-binding CsgD family transcriptional regulator/tetratricopeptide (TPR) repeat protein
VEDGEGEQPRLVGRGPELALLRTALTRAAAGVPGVVLVAGEAGVGKSRLVETLLSGPQPAPLVLRSQGVDLGEPGLPSLAVLDLVRALRTAGASHPLLDRVGVDDEVDRLRVLDALVVLLGEVSADRPVVVVAEDVQWYDASSADFLRFLATRLTHERLLVVATVRTDGVAGRPGVRRLLGDLGRLPAVARIDLEPFTEDEVADYLTAAGRDAPDAAEVRRRTGGNPLYVATLAATDEPVGDGLPRGLTDLLVGRADALPDDARTAVRVAAVAPYPVPDRVLRGVLRAGAGLDDAAADAALRAAVGEGLLRADGDTYVFAHDVLRRALHDDLLPGERSRWHGAYADTLADLVARGDQGWATEVAHHAEQAGDLAGSVAWSRRAAVEAERALAPDEALHHLERVLAHQPTGELAVRAARAAGLAGERERAVEWARRSVALHDEEGDPDGRVLSRAEWARQLLGVDRPGEAVPPAAAAIEVADREDVPPATAGLASLLLARALVSDRRPLEARPHAEQALAVARAAGAQGLEADTLTTSALLDELGGDRGRAAQQHAAAIRLARDAGEPAIELRAHFGLASLHYYNGDLTAALPVLRAALDRVGTVGLRWSAHGVELRLLLSLTHYAAGDLAASLAVAGAVAGADAGSRPPDVAAARLAAVGCYAAVARGGPDAAERTAALAGSWDLDPQVALVAGGCEADRLAWAGEPAAAVDTAARAQAHLDATVGEGMYGGLWLSALGLAALADLAATARLRRDRAAEADALRRGEPLLARVESLAATGHGRPGALGPEGTAWWLRARAEAVRLRGEPGTAEWEAAHDAFGWGHRYEQARCRWRLAEAAVAAHDRPAARAHADAAAAEAGRMRAAPLAAAVAALVQRARLAGHESSATSVLTGREREVLALVAEGLTNREIGRRLFISEKTASVHLSNLMAKLDVSSRTEAVTVAHRRGLLDVL